MLFNLSESKSGIPSSAREQLFLVPDNWDDYSYHTLYEAWWVDKTGAKKRIGPVKIGHKGLSTEENQGRPKLRVAFNRLSENYFSIGQDISYYEKLFELTKAKRERILVGLRDMAFDVEIFHQFLTEDVTRFSLLRFVNQSTVMGQFNRFLCGEAALTPYNFRYVGPKQINDDSPPVTLRFRVNPEQHIPTNVHVLIGRNGAGKTYLLENMAKALVDQDAPHADVGMFVFEDDKGGTFSNIVSVSFSVFDLFQPLPEERDKSKPVQYYYIGLKEKIDKNNAHSKKEQLESFTFKTWATVEEEFVNSAKNVRISDTKRSRWKSGLRTLESDPFFKTTRLSKLADADFSDKKTHAIFRHLSSGHKIVLFTITRLVETIEDRTLVLFDEPETHLHPPLLSSLVRVVSELLKATNGVAIIATHSPVVLQEVPKECAWIINRLGDQQRERPNIQTFGENVGILTQAVFGLDVFKSGYHSLLQAEIDKGKSYEKILQWFGADSLGEEASSILLSLASDEEESND